MKQKNLGLQSWFSSYSSHFYISADLTIMSTCAKLLIWTLCFITFSQQVL